MAIGRVSMAIGKKEYDKKYMKEYYQKNKEEIREKNKIYRQNNKEKILEYNKS